MSDQSDVDRGLRAAALLENKLLQGAFEALDLEYLTAWKTSQARDVEGREKLFLAIHVLGRVKAHLETMVRDGHIAKATINELGRTPAAHRK